MVTYPPLLSTGVKPEECYFVIEEWSPGVSTTGMDIDPTILENKDPTRSNLGVCTETHIRLDYLAKQVEGYCHDRVEAVVVLAKYHNTAEVLKEKIQSTMNGAPPSSGMALEVEIMDPHCRLPVYYMVFCGNTVPIAPNRNPTLGEEGVTVRVKNGVTGKVNSTFYRVKDLVEQGCLHGLRFYLTETEALEDKLNPLRIENAKLENTIKTHARIAAENEEKHKLEMEKHGKARYISGWDAAMDKMASDNRERNHRYMEKDAKMAEKTANDKTTLYINGLKVIVAIAAMFKLWGMASK